MLIRGEMPRLASAAAAGAAAVGIYLAFRRFYTARVAVLQASPDTVVLVTGASGWVGGHVCKALIAEGFSVRAAVRDPAASRVNFLADMGCTLVRVPDLLSDEGWAAAMEGCQGLVHVASPVDLTGNADETEMVRVAVDGTERAMRFAAAAGTVRRVVVTATMASVCGTQRDRNSDHLWSEADQNDSPATAYSKSKTAAEATVWRLAKEFGYLYAVTTVHPAVVLGTLLPGQPVTSTIGLIKQIFDGKIVPSMFGVCDAVDVALVHVLGLTRAETAGQRYLVCDKNQWSTLELAEMAAAAGASGVDLSAWHADEKVVAMRPKKPATDNRKACALLGVDELIAPALSVAASYASLRAQGHLHK